VIRPAVVASLALLTTVALGGCTSDPSSGGDYTYDPDKAAVDVDTAALRAQKAGAGIPDCPDVSADAEQQDRGLPTITLPCLGGGRSVDLAGLRGEPTVLNFWAQTCGPCRQESPMLQQLHETGKVRVLGLDFYDPLPDRAIAFAHELGLDYPQLADPEAVTRAPMQVQGLPMTFFLDGDGQVKHVEYGAVQSAADLATLVKTYLGVHVELG
jgi:cytochrome c biogenesis protein CcmG, thiol:disulfide interchange protein DsbE